MSRLGLGHGVAEGDDGIRRSCAALSLLLFAVLAARAWTAAPAVQAAQGSAGSGSGGPGVLKLPATPYTYRDVELPIHFRQPIAARFDNTPPDNPVTDAGATLGRVLFYDTRLSANGTTSCSSCHVQQFGFADPRPASGGFAGGATDRHAMNLVNLRYHPRARFFWDERGGNLESMVLLPIENRLEMGQDLARLPEILARDRHYPGLFKSAFGDPDITTDRIGRALAQFLRAMVSYRSKYDEGRAAASSSKVDFANFTAQENRGKALFLRNCALCHLPDQDAHFVMNETVNTGLDADTVGVDGGVGDITLNPNDVGLFKSPSLRNVAVTGRYMHDGRFATLDEVLDHYSSGGKNHPNKDVRVQPLRLTASEKAALVAFLQTLTDPSFLSDPRFSDPFIR
jgi:cytochrome c peroxidase